VAFDGNQSLPECEVSAETRALQDLNGIIKCNGFFGRVEGDRKQATITAVGVAKAIVQGARGAVLWVMDILDYRSISWIKPRKQKLGGGAYLREKPLASP